MKSRAHGTFLLLTLGLLISAQAANAQGQSIAFVQKLYLTVQTGATTVADDTQNGPWLFSTQVPSITSTPTVAPPNGSSFPYAFTLNSAGTAWMYTSPAYPSENYLDVSSPFNNGPYHLSFNGHTYLLNLTGNTLNGITGGYYPNSPVATVSQGSWVAGSGGALASTLVVDPTQPLTITYNFTTNYIAGDAYMVMSVNGTSYSNQVASPNFSQSQLSLTIPANTLTAGNQYNVTMQSDYASALDLSSAAPIDLAAFFGAQTSFLIKASGQQTAPTIAVQPQSQTAAIGAAVNFSVQANGTQPLSYQWYLNGVAISGATQSTYTIPSASASLAGSYTVAVSNQTGTVTSNGATLTVATAAAPAFTVQPSSQTIVSGTTVVFSAAASGTPTPTLQWYLNGTAVGSTNSSRLVISGATAANAGSYTCVATNSAGTATSNAAVLTLTSTTSVGRLINLSVNAVTGSGNQLMTVGFVTGGGGTSGSQSLLIRASGPALIPYGVTGTLPDPQLTVFNSADTSIASNAGWGTPASNVAPVEAAETNTQAGLVYGSTSSLDSATVQTLGSGAYTVQVSGKSGDSGRTLAEVYDDTPANTYTLGTPRLINVSCRIQVSAGSSLTEGFIIGGSTSKTVLIRAIGPGLTQYGISGVMPDPQLMIYNSADSVIASNVGWGGDPQLTTVMNAVGSQPNPPASADSVVVLTLAPGSYTAVAQSASGAAGDVLVDIYEVP